MPEKIVRIADKNRLTIPKQVFEDIGLIEGGYVLIRWDSDKKLIEICPCAVNPIPPA